MASTRNINAAGDYALECTRRERGSQYTTNKVFGRAQQACLAGEGLLPGRMHHLDLAYNGVDVESFLRGIRATDLENGAYFAKPDLHVLPSLGVFMPRQIPSVPSLPIADTNARYAPS
jgi:hypothetical protein